MQWLQVIGGLSLPELRYVEGYTLATDGAAINLGTRGIGPVPTNGDRLVVVVGGFSGTPAAVKMQINGVDMTQVAYQTVLTVGYYAGIWSYVLNSGTTADFVARRTTTSGNITTSMIGTYALYNLDSTTVRDTDTAASIGAAVSVDVLSNGIAIGGFHQTTATNITGFTTLTRNGQLDSEGRRLAVASGSELAAATLTEDPTGGENARVLATWR